MGQPQSLLAAPWPARSARQAMIMGIVNATPDSFSDGGRFGSTASAINHAEALAAEGADILDIGGESTRPGAVPVPEAEERDRVMPLVSALKNRKNDIPISIDTYKSATAAAALAAGATIVNDVWGLSHDPDMARVVAEHEAGLVIMHNRASAESSLDIVEDMRRFFSNSLEIAFKAGIPANRIALDPGIGFGKTFDQNLAAIRAIPRLNAMGHAVLLGCSRKSFLGLITGRPVDARLSGTLACAMIGLELGASILRVHDVAAHVDALRVHDALSSRELS
ncbi:FolP Dihydropteroate synthase and related enzymes [Rhabdaerophilaceae bacterium]